MQQGDSLLSAGALCFFCEFMAVHTAESVKDAFMTSVNRDLFITVQLSPALFSRGVGEGHGVTEQTR